MNTRVRVVQTLRRPLFGEYGRYVVMGLCGWEVLALNISGIPAVSAVVKKVPPAGWIILAMLVHHWYWEIEPEQTVVVVADAGVSTETNPR